ncbi:hypothetical protein DAEQUDRAFT_714864 [Daedalea quercina L-15889]|uniref:MYND-type domain-containing protein n=1 Tax=Daedalea quercina L-15889 TaxID=1314783 RepID=A0A165N454_9APHY|nr:hypothetical protein DAEQUDRAFT_714864 [Daedalea quercina L-15889]
MVKLYLCSRRKSLYYCSRECQKKDWRYHNSMERSNQHLEDLSLTDARAAQRVRCWDAWSLQVANIAPYVSALRLHEDAGRSQKHFITEQSIYTPDAGPLAKDKFKIVKCSVFRISDARTKIPRLNGMNACNGVGILDRAMQDMPYTGSNPAIGILIMRFGEGVGMSLSHSMCQLPGFFEQGFAERDWCSHDHAGRPQTDYVQPELA